MAKAKNHTDNIDALSIFNSIQFQFIQTNHSLTQ